MRLTSPRWARRIVQDAGNPQRRGLINWIQGLSKHDKKRRDIIDRDLCDETIDLLRPSLPAPFTCDIIDVNPGVGVWSQCLHQALKPRRHVFVETEYENYKDKLSPLLQSLDSPYRLAPSINAALDEKNDFLSAELRSTCRSRSNGSQSMDKKDPTAPQLIVTANLAQKLVKSNGFQGAMSKLFIEHFCRSTSMSSGAFEWDKYGLVKLLAWVPEADKNSFNPRCASFRYRAAKQLEAACNIREIVSSFPNDGNNSQRTAWHGAELQSMQEVAKIQAAGGINIPAHRQQPPPQPPSIFVPPREENFSLLRSIKNRPALVDQYIELYNKAKAMHPDWVERYIDNPIILRKGPEHVPRSDDIRRLFATLHVRMKTTHGRYATVDNVARDQIELERQLALCRENYPTEPERYLKLLKKLQPQFDALKERQSGFFKDNKHAVMKAIDEYRALARTPHLLNWNNRQFEPLLCHPKKEFYPHQPMSLLEFTPRPEFVDFIGKGDRPIIFDYVTHLFEYSRLNSVKKVIELLVGEGEAYDQFVGTFGDPNGIPSLTDPLHGGSHDLDSVRGRSLWPHQIMDIVKRYEKWPWRKTPNEMLELVSRFGSERKIF